MMDGPAPETSPVDPILRALIEASARERWALLPTGPEDEHWWAIPGVYWISTRGRVVAVARSNRAPGRWVAIKELRVEQRVGKRPHVRTNLRVRPDVRKAEGCAAARPVRVHRLVAAAWQPRVGGELVRHLNGDGCDNRIENLLRGTHTQNLLDQYALGERGRPEDQPETLPFETTEAPDYQIDPDFGF